MRTPHRLVIVDPGAEPAQVERLNTLIAPELEDGAREVLLLLTHAHLDHFAAVGTLQIATGRPRTLVHAIGARAIREKDTQHMLAFLYRVVPVPDFVVDGTFFAAGPDKHITRRQEPGPDGAPVVVERLMLEPDLALDVYETPGHSPCSCTFRIGRHLIIGDVLFGASPGLAGLAGWSSDGLTRSTRLIRHLVQSHDITMCWNGHGDAVTGTTALKMLSNVEAQAATLSNIAVVDEDRISLLREFAIELLHEIDHLLTLIGARLMVVAYHLENMEEREEARRLTESLDIDALEQQLVEFRKFHHAFERGEQPELSVAMKAGATLGRVRRAIAEHRDGASAALSLTARAEYLIDAFLQMLRGLTFQPNMTQVNLGEVVTAIVRHEQSPHFGADDLLAATEDEEAFRRLLIGNLMAGSVLSKCEVNVQAVPVSGTWDGTAVVHVPAFQNILLTTLEALAAGDEPGPIDISFGRENGQFQLRISRSGKPFAIPSTREALYNRAMRQMGGTFSVEQGDVVIQLEPGETFTA
ncbi:MBL fold metallo-hydrolase [Microbacteriaceae bacterium K1510]|nr:MBL fold metallo-hydrolase [Microbacteriaceae bacterium K1510]